MVVSLAFVSVNESHSTNEVHCALKGYLDSPPVHLTGLCSEGPAMMSWGRCDCRIHC